MLPLNALPVEKKNNEKPLKPLKQVQSKKPLKLSVDRFIYTLKPRPLGAVRENRLCQKRTRAREPAREPARLQ